MPKRKPKVNNKGKRKETSKDVHTCTTLKTAHQLVGQSSLDRMRDRSITDPVYQYCLNVNEEAIAQAQDPRNTLTHTRGYVDPKQLLQHYSDSPTAQRHLIAFDLYFNGWVIITNYGKQSVTTELDCCEIEEGFHSLAKGRLLECHMGKQFPLNRVILRRLLVEYLKLRPNDTLVGYLKVVYCDLLSDDASLSAYEGNKNTIRSLEMLAYKIEPYTTVNLERIVLSGVYFILGSVYTTTYQTIRAEDAFKKCYDLHEEDLPALYALGYILRNKSPEKSKTLLDKYLALAPRCDEKYPEAHYLIGYFFLQHCQNMRMAKKYYQLAQEAESFRLPFNPPTDFPTKSTLDLILSHTKGYTPHALLY